MALFKGENRHESMSMVIGSILLIVGLIVLFIGFAFAFSILSNPSAYLESQMPGVEDQAKEGPRAEFRYNVTGYTVTLTDTSQQGDASIVSWEWEWGDGATASGNGVQTHTYSLGSWSITLTVRDSNDKSSSAIAHVEVSTGAVSNGNSSPDISDLGSAINFESILGPLLSLPYGFVAVFLAFLMMFIIWLVGASILKAGWNLIRPRPETIRVRIKPKDLQAEPVYPTTYAATPQAPASPQPPPPLFPPETPPPQQYSEPPPPIQ